MTNYSSLLLFLLLSPFLYGCVASAQSIDKTKTYLRPTNDIGLYYKSPPTEVIKGYSGKCAMGLAKAVENHNAFYKAEGTTPNFYDVIGEHSFIKRVWCYPDQKVADQFVVQLILDNKERYEQELKSGRTTMGPTTYTFFDKDLNIVRWGR